MSLYGDTKIEDVKLEQLGQIDWSSGSYEFDYTTVWRYEVEGDQSDPDRDVKWKYVWAEDAGCSCPEPYESIGELSQLTDLTNLNDFHAHLVERNGRPRGGSYDRSMDIVRLIEKLHELGVR